MTSRRTEHLLRESATCHKMTRSQVRINASVLCGGKVVMTWGVSRGLEDTSRENRETWFRRMLSWRRIQTLTGEVTRPPDTASRCGPRNSTCRCPPLRASWTSLSKLHQKDLRPGDITWVESTPTVCLVSRRGLGQAKHVDMQNLWTQEASKSGRFVKKKVGTSMNPPDVMTEAKDRATHEPHGLRVHEGRSGGAHEDGEVLHIAHARSCGEFRGSENGVGGGGLSSYRNMYTARLQS